MVAILIGCSGPGAAAVIEQSIVIGYFCAAVGAVATLALGVDAWRTRDWKAVLIPLGMLAIHPAWTISAIHGDCGFFKREVAFVFTAVYIGLLAARYVLSKRTI